MQNKTLHNKRILITGIGGFVGSSLAMRLRSLGADVYGIAKNVSHANNVLNADILDKTTVENFIKNEKIDICFHLAGKSLVEIGQKDPYETFKVNIQGTLNILDSAQKYNLERVIIASTSHVYGNNRLPYYEGYTPRPTRPYETSKACTDLIAQAYAITFNLPLLIPRFVNIYGPGDLHFTRLIPKTMQAVLSGKSPAIWGGSAIRDYIYIDDAIDAYVKLLLVDLKKVGENRIFNFGSGLRVSVNEIVNKIIELSGRRLAIKRAKEEREEEILAQYVSVNKAKKILGWKARTSLDDGLKKSLAWYENYFSR